MVGASTRKMPEARSTENLEDLAFSFKETHNLTYSSARELPPSKRIANLDLGSKVSPSNFSPARTRLPSSFELSVRELDLEEEEEEEEEKEEHKPTKRLKALDASKKDAKKDDGAQQKAKGKAPMTLPDDEDTEEAKKPRGRPAKNPPPPPGSPAVAEETAKLETPKSAKNKGGRPRSVQKLKDADKAMKSEAGDSPGKRGRPSTLALEVQAGKSGCTAAEAKAMSAPELKAKYTDMFGVKCNSSNADWIRKKIAAAIS
mmetsp:Transcript_36597/g.61677  ORF Transcript_36597/g.61677 Transcript_36597/m.61677 type:complete len:259 (-) Transcript_36597:1069-1845(-)